MSIFFIPVMPANKEKLIFLNFFSKPCNDIYSEYNIAFIFLDKI